MNGHRSAPHCYGSLELLELISNQSCASKGKHSMMKTKTKMSVLPSPSHNPRPRHVPPPVRARRALVTLVLHPLQTKNLHYLRLVAPLVHMCMFWFIESLIHDRFPDGTDLCKINSNFRHAMKKQLPITNNYSNIHVPPFKIQKSLVNRKTDSVRAKPANKLS